MFIPNFNKLLSNIYDKQTKIILQFFFQAANHTKIIQFLMQDISSKLISNSMINSYFLLLILNNSFYKLIVTE